MQLCYIKHTIHCIYICDILTQHRTYCMENDTWRIIKKCATHVERVSKKRFWILVKSPILGLNFDWTIIMHTFALICTISLQLWSYIYDCYPAGRLTSDPLSSVMQPLTGCVPGLSCIWLHLHSHELWPISVSPLKNSFPVAWCCCPPCFTVE